MYPIVMTGTFTRFKLRWIFTSTKCVHAMRLVGKLPCRLNKIQHPFIINANLPSPCVPFGVTYEKIGTIQRRLAWPLHKDDTLSRSGRSTDLNIYFILYIYFYFVPASDIAIQCITNNLFNHIQ